MPKSKQVKLTEEQKDVKLTEEQNDERTQLITKAVELNLELAETLGGRKLGLDTPDSVAQLANDIDQGYRDAAAGLRK
jgi:hypothetical protein